MSTQLTHSARVARGGTAADSAAIAEIYNQGIDDRLATFETRARTAADVRGWFDGVHPVVVVEQAGRVIAFASTSTYRPREHRRSGAGRMALEALVQAAQQMGFWKLLSRVFVENTASRRLLVALGFREVGVYQRHAQLDGEWRDVVIVERL